MRYSQKDILLALKECKIKNEVGFISVLPHFTFDNLTKKLVDYTMAPRDGVNDLSVFSTDLIEIKTGLVEYFQTLELSEINVLIFCINEMYIPKENQIRLKVV